MWALQIGQSFGIWYKCGVLGAAGTRILLSHEVWYDRIVQSEDVSDHGDKHYAYGQPYSPVFVQFNAARLTLVLVDVLVRLRMLVIVTGHLLSIIPLVEDWQ